MDSNNYRKLVQCYLEKKATDEELAVFSHLLKKGVLDPYLKEAMDLDADILAGEERIKGEDATTGKPLRKIPPVLRYAAVALLVLGAGGAGLWLSQPKQPLQPATSEGPSLSLNDIPPGSNGAILTLSDGKAIVLDSLANGVITSQGGTPVILSKGLLSYSDTASAGTNVERQAVINLLSTPRGRQFKIILPDGTRAWLNAASSLRYPSFFSGKERRVEITGEVYFEVAGNDKMPFRVSINPTTTVDVLGTHFNINAYEDEPAVTTTLLEGSVRINHIVSTGKEQHAIIKPGQRASISSNSASNNSINNNVIRTGEANIDQAIAWKNGLFYFKDADILSVMHQLQRWYDIEVVIRGELPNRKFAGEMHRDLNLSEVLELLDRLMINFKIEDGRKLIITP